MRNALVLGIGGVGILAMLAAVSLGWFSSEKADFNFAAADGKGFMAYRCEALGSPDETEQNARAAHAFFEPVLLDSARVQGEAMAELLTSGRPSSEVARDLDRLNAASESQRKAIHRDLQRNFNCEYLSST